MSRAQGGAKVAAPRQSSSTTQAAKTEAAKIISQYVKAIGGARALSRIQALSLEGTVVRSSQATAESKAAPASQTQSASGTYTFDTKFPNRYYAELLIGGKRFIDAYNGKSAWHEEASGAPSAMVSPASTEMQGEALMANTRLLDLKKSKLAAAFVGHAQVGGKDALHVEVSTAAGVKREFFFDAQSHLIVEESGSVGSVSEQIFYSDYRPEIGVQIARKLELDRGPDVYSVEITHVAINPPIGERVFDLPLSEQVKLPDLKALFKELDEHQKAIDKIKEDYAGTRVEDETEYESNGTTKKHTVTESTFFYLDGEEVSTVTKRDGKPLSDAEEKKETEKTQKRVEEIQKRTAKKDAKEEKAQEEGKPPKDDDVDIEKFLRACQFVNPRRERFRGQDLLAFDFEANPEYKPRNLTERIVQKLAGSIWIDEQARDVVRLEGYFVGDAKIAGGVLASVQQGTRFVFEQEYVNNEVWLPTLEEAQVSARVLLVKGVRATDVIRYSGYKKYHVATTSAIVQPKPQ
ncbi:MAG: hypothetical protein ACLQVG_07400 [Terriglobia bacterium]